MSDSQKPTLILRDKLAIDRTHLANERTFLAYFRSFLVFASSGIAVWQIDALAEIWYLGFVLLGISPLFLLIGLFNYRRMKHKIEMYYQP